MDSEIKTIISFIFKRSGKELLSYSRFYLTLSMDLNWFTPEDAKQLINVALEQKLLTKKDDLIKPTFDINEISAPLGFHPSKKILNQDERKNEDEKDAIQLLIKKIAKKENVNEQEIISKIKKVESERNILFEIATLLVAKDFGMKIEDYIKEIEEKKL